MKIIDGIEKHLTAASVPCIKNDAQLIIPLTQPDDNRVIQVYVSEEDGGVCVEGVLSFPVPSHRKSTVAQLIGYLNTDVKMAAMEIDHHYGIVRVEAELTVGQGWHKEKWEVIRQAIIAVDTASCKHFERVLMVALSERIVEDVMDWHNGRTSCLTRCLTWAPDEEEDVADPSSDIGKPLFEFVEDDREGEDRGEAEGEKSDRVAGDTNESSEEKPTA